MVQVVYDETVSPGSFGYLGNKHKLVLEWKFYVSKWVPSFFLFILSFSSFLDPKDCVINCMKFYFLTTPGFLFKKQEKHLWPSTLDQPSKQCENRTSQQQLSSKTKNQTKISSDKIDE